MTMKKLSEHLDNPVPNGPVGSDQLSPGQRDSIAYFFFRLKTTDPQQYNLIMPGGKTEAAIKREYATHVMNFTRDKIDLGFEQLHKLRQANNPDYNFLNIDKVIGLINGSGMNQGRAGIHKPFPPRIEPSEEELSRRQQVGRRELDKIKKMLDESFSYLG